MLVWDPIRRKAWRAGIGAAAVEVERPVRLRPALGPGREPDRSRGSHEKSFITQNLKSPAATNAKRGLWAIMPRQSVLLYTYALTGGGAERVWALLSSGFAARGWDVTLAVDFHAPENGAFVGPRVRIETLGRGHGASTLRLARLLARTKPDVSISAMSGSNLKHAAAAALAGRLNRAVLSFHGYSTTEPQVLSKLGYIGIPVLTRAAGAVVCVSDGLVRHVVDEWRGDPKKTVRIYNPAQIGSLQSGLSAGDLRARPPLVLASGRLVSYKNFQLLLRAFASIEVPGARLCLLGEGPERASLEAEISRLGLQGRVDMPGYAIEPWSWYEKASCFVSSSDQEPFGLVVVEALAHGLPVVATACDGPREILAGGYGELVGVGDEAGLAKAIAQALVDPGDPAARFARAADFTTNRAIDEYEKLFEQMLARAARRSRTPQESPQPRPTASGHTLVRDELLEARDDAAITAKRKLIFYTHALAGGGAERVWALLASGFARAGHQVSIAVDFEAAENQGYVDPAVKIIVLGGGHFTNVARLRALIRRENPDVVFAALCVSNLKATLAAIGAGALDRTVLSYHGFFGSEAQTLSVLSYCATPLLTRLAAATIAVSDSLKRHLVKAWRGDARRIVRIYNPIDCASRPAPTRAELAGRRPAILAGGRLEKRKGFDALLRAFALVEPHDATLTIMGEGAEREALGELAERLGVADRVSLVGYQPEPWPFYRSAKCLAVSSRSEAFGLVVAEALAHGLAVVSTDCRGPREILADGTFGALTPVGDFAALARELSAALADPGDPGPRVARARQFSIDQAMTDYAALVEDRIDARQRKPRSSAALARGDRGARRIV